MKSTPKEIENFCHLLEFISKNYPDLILSNSGWSGESYNEPYEPHHEQHQGLNDNPNFDMGLLNTQEYENMARVCLSQQKNLNTHQKQYALLQSNLTNNNSFNLTKSISLSATLNYSLNYNMHNNSSSSSISSVYSTFPNLNVLLNLVAYNLVKYVYPIILAFGIVGNFVSFMAMLNRYYNSRRHPKTVATTSTSTTSSSTYYTFSFCLAILCLADFFMLVIGCLSVYLEQVSILETSSSFRSQSLFTCKAFRFACYLLSSFISYLHAYIAIDRWYAMARPIEHKQRWQTSMRQSQKHLMALFAFCFLICLPFLYFPTSESWVGFF
jgi:hypothetical protein